MKSIWFTTGFVLGLLFISLGQAALPKKAGPVTPAPKKALIAQPASAVSEIKAPKVTAPDLENDFDRLERAEARYAESWEQQQKIKAATNGQVRSVKKSRQ